jgi:hypothetical protein
MIIQDLKKHVEDKAKWDQDRNTTEYRTMLMAAVHAEVSSLQMGIDAFEKAHKSAKANKLKRTLMTIFALLEQVPWVCLEGVSNGQGIEQRTKDTLLAEERMVE